MKKQILAGTVAALVYSGAAVAAAPDASVPPAPSDARLDVQPGSLFPESIVDGAPVLEENSAKGGSGTGGSGMTPTGTGVQDVGTGAYSTQTNPTVFVPAGSMEKGSGADMRGLTVLAGVGVEGYTYELAPRIQAGAAWSVLAALKPTKVLGLEFSYNGAANEIKRGDASTVNNGPDIVRHGGQAVVTLGLSGAAVQPYILGGLGVSRYDVRSSSPGFSDDTVGAVPVGAGIRAHIGDFTADARLGYNFLFDQEFAGDVSESTVGAPGGTNFSNGGRYIGTVNVGTTF